ncbi:MAG: YciI family protein [Gemmatimonadaceae bacterium]
MYALAILRYRRPLEEVVTVTDDHRAYMRGLHEEGTLLASGPMDPRSGGILLLRVPDEDSQAALDRVRDGDPYVLTGMAQYELLPWLPTVGLEGLDAM